jgi:hypothetical protein
MVMHRTAIKLVILVVMSLILPAAGATEAPESKVKVHKKHIRVLPPDEQGMVSVVGKPGAISSSSAVSLEIANVTTGVSLAAEQESDGSFAMKIAGVAGDKIRVYARNAEGKKSRGTFKVPLGYIRSDGQTDATGAKPVIVWVRVVDARTGTLLSARSVTGQLEEGAGKEKNRLKQFMDSCAAFIRGNLANVSEQHGSSKSNKAVQQQDPNVPVAKPKSTKKEEEINKTRQTKEN